MLSFESLTKYDAFVGLYEYSPISISQKLKHEKYSTNEQKTISK